MSDPKENAPDKAARLGMDLILPTDHELFVDIDAKYALDIFHQRFDLFKTVCKDATKQYTKSKSGNWHVYVTVPSQVFTMDERIALQAALGSDPLREMIATFHHKEGYQYPSVFFEHPNTVRADNPHTKIRETFHAIRSSAS